MTDREQPLFTHLAELRKRLIIAVFSWVVAFMGCYHWAQWLFAQISQPVQQALPEGSSLVFIHAVEPFFAYLKIAAVAGLIVALPVILWQLGMFIAPAMDPGEKRLLVPFVVLSFVCFTSGTYFGFFYIFPVMFTFLINFGLAAGEVQAMLSMGGYLSMAIRLLMAFGLVFELPIVLCLLARLGVVDHRWLARHRRYALLVGVVVGAMLTPPDMFSQIAIALPFVLLYEVGILGARLVGKKPASED